MGGKKSDVQGGGERKGGYQGKNENNCLRFNCNNVTTYAKV